MQVNPWPVARRGGDARRRSALWPEGKRFAFTIFDDTDLSTLENTRPVYDSLAEHGFRTTKSVWPVAPSRANRGDISPIYDYDIAGDTCADRHYLAWAQSLQAEGFEIGFHNATYLSAPRADTLRALDAFRDQFGVYPRTYATHFQCVEGMYWGSARLSGLNRVAYNLLKRYRTHGVFSGHVPGSKYFWGDACRDRIRYVRNFVFRDINTLRACPYMPYHDRSRPYVNAWFASSNGADLNAFNEMLCEKNQDRLAGQGGACIMYTHFAKGFFHDGGIDKTFLRLMRRLSAMDGWFVPVTGLLDHLRRRHGLVSITPRDRTALERRWLLDKVLSGGS